MGTPRGVIHSTAEPVSEMSRALSVSQRCGDEHQVSRAGSGATARGRGRIRPHLDGPGAREHLLEAVEHLAHKVVRCLPHELLEKSRVDRVQGPSQEVPPHAGGGFALGTPQVAEPSPSVRTTYCRMRTWGKSSSSRRRFSICRRPP